MDREPRLRLPRAVSAPILFAAVLLLGLVAWKGVWPALASADGDFAKYYTASRVALEGDAFENAYGDVVWFQKRMEMAGVEGQVGGFIPHPPSAALPLLPLAWLRPLAAKRAWTLINVVLAVLCVWLLSRAANLDWLLAFALFLGTGLGLVNNLLHGQLYLALLASLLAGIVLAERRPFFAGFCLGVLGPVKYVGGLYLLSAAWERKWRIVLGGALSVSLVLAATVWLTGTEPLEVFVRTVFLRHLEGGIQDPFASRFQSWNSLLRRLFVADPVSNPHPALDSPGLFAATRSLVLCGWLALWLRTYLINKCPNNRAQSFFRTGWIVLGVLLLSPAGATYHFLLLTIPTAVFVSLALRRGENLTAAAFASLHLAINFPHFLYLESWTEGWWNLFGYSRLVLLSLFFLLAVWRFGGPANRASTLGWAGAACSLALMLTAVGTILDSGQADDQARLLVRPTEAGALRVLSEPSIGSRLLLFYCIDLLPNEKAGICDSEARNLAPDREKNWYGVKVARDDAQILAETVENGTPWIWNWTLRDDGARRVAEGEGASWSPDSRRFAYHHRGRIFVWRPDADSAAPVARWDRVVGLDWSPAGDRLAVAVRDGSEYALLVVDLATATDSILLRDGGAIGSPRWSPTGESVLFSWRRGANRDIWALRPRGGDPIRLTRDAADDDHPAWDAANGRLIFASDRGRGLGFPTLFWLPLPNGLR